MILLDYPNKQKIGFILRFNNITWKKLVSSATDSALVRSYCEVKILLVRYFNVSIGIKDVKTEQTEKKKWL